MGDQNVSDKKRRFLFLSVPRLVTSSFSLPDHNPSSLFSTPTTTGTVFFVAQQVMGQILPGVPVWSMADDSRWPGLPLVVFPGNVGGKEALAEAMTKVRGGRPAPNVVPLSFEATATEHLGLPPKLWVFFLPRA